MTTTEIYYNKGYSEGKNELMRCVGKVMDEMSKKIGKDNYKYGYDWNRGFDDGIRTFYVALENSIREEVL